MRSPTDKTYKMLTLGSIFETAPYLAQMLWFEVLSIFNIASIIIVKPSPAISEIVIKSTLSDATLQSLGMKVNRQK